MRYVKTSVTTRSLNLYVLSFTFLHLPSITVFFAATVTKLANLPVTPAPISTSTMHLSSLLVASTAVHAACGLAQTQLGSTRYEDLASGNRDFRAIQSRASNTTLEQERANAIRDAFIFAWNGYFTACKGQDEFQPVTNTCTNSRNSWGASAVDALSTALVMEIQAIVTDILDYIPTIDFTTSATQVSLIETTIRYLAGMLSGYGLLKDEILNVTASVAAIEALLTQSQRLADSLMFAFDTPTGIPLNGVYLNNRSRDGSTSNNLATISTLVLEWQHLSNLTGNFTYGDLAQKAETYLLNPQPTYNEPFPGLVGSTINNSNGAFLDATGGWNGGGDSFYEYLIKMYIYDSSRYSNYSDRWVLAADSTMKYLTSHPFSRPDLMFLASYVNTSLSTHRNI